MDLYTAEAKPCPRCLALVKVAKLRVEMLQPLRGGARDALAVDGSGHCCRDCKAADTLMRFSARLLDFEMARIATGNARQEQLRLPGYPMGYVREGIMEPSEPGELDRHHAWLARVVPDLWGHPCTS